MRANALDRLDYKLDDFRFIQGVMLQHAGINLNEGKRELVYSRLAKRIRCLGLDRFEDYCRVLSEDEREIIRCINAMTTNVTSFFRERHHFDFMKDEILKPGADLRIWSAGCSSGEEPYSIAFTCQDAMLKTPSINAEILATDLDSDILGRAQRGVYTRKDVVDLKDSELRKWFLKGRGVNEGKVRVMKEAQKLVSFAQLNLKEEWVHDRPFDVIFCRNVMIYFNGDLRARLLQRFHDALKPGGYLVLGHSESLFGLATGFKVVGKTIHQKMGE